MPRFIAPLAPQHAKRVELPAPEPTLQPPPVHPGRRRSTVPLPGGHASMAPEPDYDDESGLPEAELRKIYENEEIDRFLRIFAREVREVRLHAPESLLVYADEDQYQLEDVLPDSPSSSAMGENDDDDDEGWMKVSDATTSLPSTLYQKETNLSSSSFASLRLASGSVFSFVANEIILPQLPDRHLSSERFTLTGLRLAVQRLYLACYPIYYPLFVKLWNLAAWTKFRSSVFWCTVYWVLWFYNALLPTLLLRMLYALVRRKILKFPSEQELSRRRQTAEHAEALGEALQSKFDSDGGPGFRDTWRAFRMVVRTSKKRSKEFMTHTVDQEGDNEREDKVQAKIPELPEDEDVRRVIMNTVQDIADFHERVKNLGLWRHPAATKRYTFALFMLLVVSSFLPARYLAKLVYFVIGVGYWFIIPSILALPRHDRARIPPALADVPTDAEYAMELIASRVARGESVLPARMNKKNRARQKKSRSVSDAPASRSAGGDITEEALSDNPSPKLKMDAEWRRWREKVVKGWRRAEDATKIFTGDKLNVSNSRLEKEPDTYQTFLAQHIASPGIITLTEDELLFTVMMAPNPKIRISLKDVQGVKKTGSLGGLTLRYMKLVNNFNSDNSNNTSGKQEVEEKFRWIAGRDEVFARIVGWGGRKWRKV